MTPCPMLKTYGYEEILKAVAGLGTFQEESIRPGQKAVLSAMEVLKSIVDAAARMGEAEKKIQLLEQKKKLLEYITRS